MNNLILSAVNKTNILTSLDILWKGMLGIFVVMALIYAAIKLLNFLTDKEKVRAVKAKLTKKGKSGETEAKIAEDAAVSENAGEGQTQ
ncbi:MAG TPA: hypothetical protein P5161_05870 [Eubacteriales bacterium]|jgi:hypothetical protein|nr:hypothetical protein [Clostridia bacterium]HRR90286.1 hypothetical protein [Eubacteriales bacterium]HRU84421.1 hypothetical protein [Eubacteriales bacterium]